MTQEGREWIEAELDKVVEQILELQSGLQGQINDISRKLDRVVVRVNRLEKDVDALGQRISEIEETLN